MADWFKTWFDEDYALLYAHRDAAEARRAVALALQEAPALARGPVLDLACGAGRHLEVLRQTNPLAFGMDLSRALLMNAPGHLHPWLVRGDMRALPVKEGALSGICLWFTPFGYFSDATNRTLMVDLGRLTRPGGALVMDYLNAFQVARTLVAEDVVERRGVRIHSHRRIEGDRLVKRMTLTRMDSGESREAMEDVHLYQPAEIQAMAAEAGFRLAKALGTYEGHPFGSESPRWIGIFERVAAGGHG